MSRNYSEDRLFETSTSGTVSQVDMLVDIYPKFALILAYPD